MEEKSHKKEGPTTNNSEQDKGKKTHEKIRMISERECSGGT